MSELCHELGISRSSVYDLRDEGLPSFLIAGRRRFLIASVRAWLESREERREDETEARKAIERARYQQPAASRSSRARRRHAPPPPLPDAGTSQRLKEIRRGAH